MLYKSNNTYNHALSLNIPYTHLSYISKNIPQSLLYFSIFVMVRNMLSLCLIVNASHNAINVSYFG